MLIDNFTAWTLFPQLTICGGALLCERAMLGASATKKINADLIIIILLR